MQELTTQQLEIISRTAASAALEHLEKEMQRNERAKKDRRFRNVKLLLRNYRALVKHCEDIKIDIDVLEEQLEIADLDADEFKIMSIKRSKQKTLGMVKFVNKMLYVYKIMCEQSGRSEDVRRFEVVEKLYILKPKMTVEEVSSLQHVAVRTIYNDIEKACEDLVVLIFGVDGISFFK